jgi:hypothetical protein
MQEARPVKFKIANRTGDCTPLYYTTSKDMASVGTIIKDRETKEFTIVPDDGILHIGTGPTYTEITDPGDSFSYPYILFLSENINNTIPTITYKKLKKANISVYENDYAELKKKQREANDKTRKYSVKTMKQDGSFTEKTGIINKGESVTIAGVVYTFDDMKKFGMLYGMFIPTITIDLQGAPSPFPANSAQPVLASTPPPPANSASERSLASTYGALDGSPRSGPTGLTSTFGAMKDYSISTFGSTASGFMIFIIILLIVGGVLYYLHSKGKVKIPGLPQRIAAFGRQIKAIRKM